MTKVGSMCVCGNRVSVAKFGEESICTNCGKPKSTKVGENVSLCKSCYCMTKTIEGKCGKCGKAKVIEDTVLDICKSLYETGVNDGQNNLVYYPKPPEFRAKQIMELIEQARNEGYVKGYKDGGGEVGKRAYVEYVGFNKKLEQARTEAVREMQRQIENIIKTEAREWMKEETKHRGTETSYWRGGISSLHIALSSFQELTPPIEGENA